MTIISTTIKMIETEYLFPNNCLRALYFFSCLHRAQTSHCLNDTTLRECSFTSKVVSSWPFGVGWAVVDWLITEGV